MATLLMLVVLVEVVGAVWLIATALMRSPYPNPDLGRVDHITAAELRSLRQRLDPSKADSWHELGDAFLAYGSLPESEACFRHASMLPPNSNWGRLQFSWGLCLARLGRLRESMDHLRQAAEVVEGPLQQDCWILIGRNALRQEDLRTAEAAFRQAGDRPPARFHLAKLLVRSGRLDEAAALVEQIRTTMADLGHFHYLAADVAEAQHRSDVAMEYRERAERSPARFDVDVQREYLAAISGKYGFLRQAPECERLQRPTAVAACLHSLLDNHPRRDHYILPLVRAELAARDLPAARQLLEEAVSADIVSAEILEQLGDVFQFEGRPNEAEAAWLRAAAWGERASIFEKLAVGYRQKRDLATAQQYRARQLEAEGVDAFRKNDLPTAMRSLESATDMNPGRARAWFYLGEACRAAGRKPEAQQAYQKCLAIEPEHAIASSTATRIPP
jgi:tetratricopeptide (TPR) repeat protein